jgi:uncharacterized membrane protein HdeD (DUF308 family)
MEKIEKKINGFLGAAIGSMAVMILIGLAFVLAPGLVIKLLRWGLAIILIVAGVLMVSRDMKEGRVFSLFSTSLLGIFFVLMGVIIAVHPETISIVTIAFGVYMILNSVMQLSIASRIRGTKAYNTALITNLIGLICGIIMILRPGDTQEVVIMIAGILLVVYGISGLVDAFILKSKIDSVKENVKKASKKAKTLLEDVKEAEVVEKDEKSEKTEKSEKAEEKSEKDEEK